METVIVKLGTSVLSGDGGLNAKFIGSLAEQVKEISEMARVVIVTSGAILTGINALGWRAVPRDLSLTEKQVAAAVGQPILMSHYINAFSSVGLRVAQILITEEDLSIRECHRNFLRTIKALLDLGIVPVINENDAVSVKELLNRPFIRDEVRFGDNDRLSALIAVGIGANRLVLLTDVDGFFVEEKGERRLVREIRPSDEWAKGQASSEGAFGRGGMKSKLEAAFLAASNGVKVHIANGRAENVLLRIMNMEPIGTVVLPQ